MEYQFLQYSCLRIFDMRDSQKDKHMRLVLKISHFPDSKNKCSFQIIFFPEVIRRVLAGETPPFRPRLTREMCEPELYDLIEACWAQDPFQRPTLAYIKSTMKAISRYFHFLSFPDADVLQIVEIRPHGWPFILYNPLHTWADCSFISKTKHAFCVL